MPLALFVTRRASLPTSLAASRVVVTERNVPNRKKAMVTLATVKKLRRLFRIMLAQINLANFIGTILLYPSA